MGRRATTLDRRGKKVVDDGGTDYTFDKLLLATGGTPRHLSFGGERVIYFRTLDDYRRLRELADLVKSFAVIGGGFIGSEIAAALAMQGCKVTLLFPEDGIGARLFPADLARFLVGHNRENGVDVRSGESVVGITERGSQVVVETGGGLRITVDAVVAGLGIVPTRTLPWPLVSRSRMASSWTNTCAHRIRTFSRPVTSPVSAQLRWARACASSMRTTRSPWVVPQDARWRATILRMHTCRFSTRICSISATRQSASWTRGVAPLPTGKSRSAKVNYLSGGRVRGVLLWNTWGQVDGARALIAEPGPLRAADLVGRLPGIA